MNWALAAGSLAAVLALAGVARLLALGGPGRIESVEQAIRLAEDAITGFDASDAVICGDGGGAVVFGSDQRIALIRPSGARFIVREVRRPSWRATDHGNVPTRRRWEEGWTQLLTWV
jgi:hypothetical protein